MSTVQFLSIEVSTQKLKAIVIDNEQNILQETDVTFGEELSEFGAPDGIQMHEDGLTFTAPTAMWIKAIDVALDKLKNSGTDFSKIVAISGAGQQHGSVYWKKGSRKLLQTLQSDKTLYSQLAECFSLPNSPIWMDASTHSQCLQLEKLLGGAQKVADVTGSKAVERFTGNQIAKIYQSNPNAYNDTERISLVSSFAASLFLGDYAGIDYSDGSGMNLLDIHTRQWSRECLNACAPSLEEKLGSPVPSCKKLGPVSTYMVDRYRFSPDCQVVAFTGDNPASVAGMIMGEGEIIISLGTSDTILCWVGKPNPGPFGVIFVNPIETKAWMGLLCWKNGSFARELIRDECAGGSWDQFNSLLNAIPAGNNGNIGIYFTEQEIVPFARGTHRFNASDKEVSSFTPEVEVRAIIEGQFLARRAYAQQMGLRFGPQSKVMATGGASSNPAILQVLADVFNVPVYVIDVPNSACLGSAYRAKHAWSGDGSIPFSKVIDASKHEVHLAASPQLGSDKVYDPLLQRYMALEANVAKMQSA